MARVGRPPARPLWSSYYRWTATRPPRELLLRTLDHIDWEKQAGRHRTAIEVGFGGGTDTLELLRRGWQVVAIDGERSAAKFLERRVPPRQRAALTIVVAPMEEIDLPQSDLVYASFSLPFCSPEKFPALWTKIRQSINPGGHFAGQIFGTRDEWYGRRPMTFRSPRQVRSLARGLKVELLRETVEEGMSFQGPKHWNFFDLILGKPGGPAAHRRR